MKYCDDKNYVFSSSRKKRKKEKMYSDWVLEHSPESILTKTIRTLVKPSSSLDWIWLVGLNVHPNIKLLDSSILEYKF